MQAGYEVATYRPSRTSSRARHRGAGRATPAMTIPRWSKGGLL